MSVLQHTPGCTIKGLPMSSYAARDERVKVVRHIPVTVSTNGEGAFHDARTVTVFNGSRAAFRIFREGGGDVQPSDQITTWNRRDPAKKQFQLDQELTPVDSLFREMPRKASDFRKHKIETREDALRYVAPLFQKSNRPSLLDTVIPVSDRVGIVLPDPEGYGEDPDGSDTVFEVDRTAAIRTEVGMKLDNGATCGGPASDCTTPSPAGHTAEIVPEPTNPVSCVPAPEMPKPKKLKVRKAGMTQLPPSYSQAATEEKLLSEPSDQAADQDNGPVAPRKTSGKLADKPRAKPSKRKR